MFPMSAYLRSVSNPSHLLPELLPEIVDEGGPITEPKNIVSTRIQQLWNKTQGKKEAFGGETIEKIRGCKRELENPYCALGWVEYCAIIKFSKLSCKHFCFGGFLCILFEEWQMDIKIRNDVRLVY